MKNLICSALLLAVSSAHASLEADAQKVIEHRLAMTKPATTFDKWQADQWAFLAAICAQEAKIALPPALKNPKIYSAGSQSFPENVSATCKALAEGPSPVCYMLNSKSLPFSSPWMGMPPYYAYLAKGAPLPLEGSPVAVGGYCELVKGKRETRQFFAGNGKLRWLQQPAQTTLLLFDGHHTVKAGTVQFEVEGLPPSAPVRLLVP